MKGSLKLGTFAGIGVYVHWTFALLIAWFAFKHYQPNQDVREMLEGVGLVLAVFLCVVLHEYGHALTARRYGIRTEDITLLPIGGVARLERMPEDPRQELWIALAGPAVNVVIAIGLFVLLSVVHGPQSAEPSNQMIAAGGNFLAKLMWINIALVVFNMIPAFPMDGGRVLRALLAHRMNYLRATQVAATIGQGLAIMFAVMGLFGGPVMLVLIGLFVFLGAQQESQMVEVRSLLRGVPVRDAMIRQFRAVGPQDSLDQVVALLLSGEQQDFPVMDGPRIVGMLTRSALLAALAGGKRDGTVAEIMRPECGSVDEMQPLEATFERMHQGQCPALPVLRHGELVGMITLENIGEWMMIQSALRQATPRGDVENVLKSWSPR